MIWRRRLPGRIREGFGVWLGTLPFSTVVSTLVVVLGIVSRTIVLQRQLIPVIGNTKAGTEPVGVTSLLWCNMKIPDVDRVGRNVDEVVFWVVSEGKVADTA
jgi:hypothetical protein